MRIKKSISDKYMWKSSQFSFPYNNYEHKLRKQNMKEKHNKNG
jgi:hypothetical protein